MKKIKIVVPALLLFAVLVGIGIAAIPAPPVNQNLGLPDTRMPNVSANLCKGCHPGASDIHHFMVSGGPGSNFVSTTNLGCLDCHPIINGQLTISRNCHDCHDGTAWSLNPNINMTVIRGAPGRPHHNSTKNSASNAAIKVAYIAIYRHCKTCHGDGYLDNYDDGHYVPNYSTSMVTPLADFKINSTIGNGKEWGGCAACHDAGLDASSGVYANNNHDTHHYETTSMLGRQCNYCHVANPASPRAEPVPDISPDGSANVLRVWLNESYPNYYQMFKWDVSMRHIEFRNNTIMTLMNDPVNGTGCEKCHSVNDLHNIESGAPELGLTQSQVLAAKIGGYGHIANNSDCNGCHQGWASAAENPFPGPKAISLESVSPGKLGAGASTDVIITGDGFVEIPYKTTVLVDGVETAPKSLTETEIIVTVNLAAGAHSLQVKKDTATSELTTLVAVEPVDAVSAQLSGTTITIAGKGFGPQPAAEFADLGVFVTSGKGKNKATTTVKAEVISWTGEQIVVSSSASNGDLLTVKALNGQDTVTINRPVPSRPPKPK